MEQPSIHAASSKWKLKGQDMRWILIATATVLTACTHQNAPDQAMLEEERLKAQSNAVFETVEEHAQCAGFHRAHARLASNDKSKADFYTNAASNAEIAATEIAATEVQKDLAVEMVNQLAETHAAEWAYAIDSNTQNQAILSQTKTCEALAQEQKNVVREIVKAKYGFKKK